MTHNIIWSEWDSSGNASSVTENIWRIMAKVDLWTLTVSQCVPDESTVWRNRIWTILYDGFVIASGCANGTEQAQRCAISVLVVLMGKGGGLAR